MQQRQISQQAASRGLGSSGLRNLAGLQSQMAQSGAINQLSQQDTQVQKEAMLTNRNINQSMADQLRNAQLQYGQMNVEADENLYNRQQAEQQQRSDFLMQLAQIAAEGGDSRLIQDLLTLSGEDLESLSQSQRDVLSGLGQSTVDPYGSVQYTGATVGTNGASGIDWSKVGDRNIDNMSYAELREIMGTAGGASSQRKYTIAGKEFVGTPEEAARQLQQYYKGFANIGAGKIEIRPDESGHLRFYVGTVANKTYEQALENYAKRSTKQTGK